MSLKIDVPTSFTGLLLVVKKLKIINMADRGKTIRHINNF